MTRVKPREGRVTVGERLALTCSCEADVVVSTIIALPRASRSWPEQETRRKPSSTRALELNHWPTHKSELPGGDLGLPCGALSSRIGVLSAVETRFKRELRGKTSEACGSALAIPCNFAQRLES